MSEGVSTVFSICVPGAKRGNRQESPWHAVAPCRLYSFGDGNGSALAIHNAISEKSPLTLRGDQWACSDPLTGRTLWVGKIGDSEEQFVSQVRYVLIPNEEIKRRNSIHELLWLQRRQYGPAPRPCKLNVRFSVE
jgi:hypothetical protein